MTGLDFVQFHPNPPISILPIGSVVGVVLITEGNNDIQLHGLVQRYIWLIEDS